MNRMLTGVLLAPMALSLALLGACEKKQPATPAGGSSGTAAAKHDDHDDHDHDEHAPGHGGKVIDLGTASVGGFSLKATRDEGRIVAGKDAAIDVTITPEAGATAKVVGVRFWIGSQDAKGSVKAKAEVEDPNDPNRWHVHAEIPDPMPEASKLWVEIETDKGEKFVGSFDLKA